MFVVLACYNIACVTRSLFLFFVFCFVYFYIYMLKGKKNNNDNNKQIFHYAQQVGGIFKVKQIVMRLLAFLFVFIQNNNNNKKT